MGSLDKLTHLLARKGFTRDRVFRLVAHVEADGQESPREIGSLKRLLERDGFVADGPHKKSTNFIGQARNRLET